MSSKTIEQAFQSIAEYVPADASKVLSQQIPKIERFIDEEADKFGRELSNYIQAEVDKEVARAEKDAEATMHKLTDSLAKISANIATNDHELEAAVNELATNLQEYEKRFKKVGEGIREAVVSAVPFGKAASGLLNAVG